MRFKCLWFRVQVSGSRGHRARASSVHGEEVPVLNRVGLGIRVKVFGKYREDEFGRYRARAPPLSARLISITRKRK